jgi:DNA-binding transcriptional ArsR family regulator
MTERDIARIDDPAHMRALAHPTRLRILGLLRANGPQTAAMLGESIDEAPGTISYHCTRLAAVDLIEQAPPRGTDKRERWWRATHAMSSWDLGDALDDPARYTATAALDRAVWRSYAASYERYLDEAPSLDRAWVDAAGGGDALLRLTADELAELVGDLHALVGRWRDRSDAHEDGDGSERVYAITQAFRWPR